MNIAVILLTQNRSDLTKQVMKFAIANISDAQNLRTNYRAWTGNLNVDFDLMGRRLAEKLKEAVNSKGISATGELANSFRYDQANGYVTFLAYGQVVNDGRRPGKFPPIKPIADWVKARNISTAGKTPEQVAFAIARDIQKRGFRPQPFIQPTISVIEQQFAEYFAQAIADDIELNAQIFFDKNINNKKFEIKL